MTRVTFTADGKNIDFYFTFPFFLKSDVFVEINSAPATQYNLTCVSDGMSADIPFRGGHVQFAKPPKQGDIITIYRNLPARRIADYQPTAPYNPTTLNQDLNYLVEMIKDTKDMIEATSGQPGIPDYADMKSVIEKIEQVIEITNTLCHRVEMLESRDFPDDLEDLSNLNATLANVCTELESLTDTIAAHTASISALDTRCTQLQDQITNAPAPTLPENIDYVVETWCADDGSSWYRKYASGWVEQGGVSTGAQSRTINLPIQMSNAKYAVLLTTDRSGQSGNSVQVAMVLNRTNTTLNLLCNYALPNDSGGFNNDVLWEVKGFMAAD